MNAAKHYQAAAISKDKRMVHGFAEVSWLQEICVGDDCRADVADTNHCAQRAKSVRHEQAPSILGFNKWQKCEVERQFQSDGWRAYGGYECGNVSHYSLGDTTEVHRPP